MKPHARLGPPARRGPDYRNGRDTEVPCTGRRIEVADRLAANGRVSVLVHELAHALVGRDAGLAKQHEELVVEAVAFIVCAGAGLDTSPDSVPYIAS
jgi:hypothetical protein